MTDDGWDFQVVQIHLNDLNVDAGQEIGMVLVQPEYELLPDATVPFRIHDAYREAQRDLIERAFRIRAIESQQRNKTIPFVLFPEAAIPVGDPDGLGCILQQMQQAEGEVIFIGGLEGLSPQEFEELVNRFQPRIDNARPDFDAVGRFVNVCVIAVKSAGNGTSWHFQAKLAPSQWEQGRGMARGRRLLYFLAPRLAFVCEICFDLIAAQGTDTLGASICRRLIQSTQPLAAPLNFVFIPQCNPSPRAESVRRNTSLMLSFLDPQLSNELASIVIINKAAENQESPAFGRCGFHYRSGRWQVPANDVGPKGYELCELENVTSAVFRKRTQSIHVATFVPPSHNIGDSGNLRQPLENPRSHLITETCDPTPCLCLPGDKCGDGSFVVCDCLPCKLRDTLLERLAVNDDGHQWGPPGSEQHEILGQHYREIRRELLALDADRAGKLLDLLLHTYDGKKSNPDTWDQHKLGAVVELTAALCVLREWMQPLVLQAGEEWTAILGDDLALVILDGEDCRHSPKDLERAYRQAFQGNYNKPQMRKRTVLLVALKSQGRIDPAVIPGELDITEASKRDRLGDSESIDEPQRPRFWVCQGNLLDEAKSRDSIQDYMISQMGCIYG